MLKFVSLDQENPKKESIMVLMKVGIYVHLRLWRRPSLTQSLL